MMCVVLGNPHSMLNKYIIYKKAHYLLQGLLLLS